MYIYLCDGEAVHTTSSNDRLNLTSVIYVIEIDIFFDRASVSGELG